MTNSTEPAIKRLLANRLLILANAVFCNSKTQTEFLRKKFGLRDKVFTVWNGYHIDEFPFKYKNFNGVNCISIIGRVAFPKNGFVLLQALDIYYGKYKRLPKVRWWDHFGHDFGIYSGGWSKSSRIRLESF
mgnify:CR=1 FL=1